MKVFILLVLIAMATYAKARPANQENQVATIVKYEFTHTDPAPGYKYSYTTSDGTLREESAEVINKGTDQESLVVRGSYQYIGPDGVVYTVSYVSDENGFQPEGEHIPPSAGVVKPSLGIPSAALASLAGGGIGK